MAAKNGSNASLISFLVGGALLLARTSSAAADQITQAPPVPIAAATAAQIAQAAPAAATEPSISGTATDAGGSPLARVTITVRGPATASTTTDGNGHYAFSGLTPGLYTIVAAKPGYAGTTLADFSVLPGASSTANVTLAQSTLTSLREIGRTSTTTSRSTFNTSPAAVQIISSQTFRDQQQPQVARILDQTPGIVSSLPGGVNGSSPGAITFPNIRGALSFETTDLVDGHPLSVGQYGDYVTTFLNSFILQDVEVIKGPGAASPTISHAIGGTVNFRTLEPTGKPSGTITLGVDSYGGSFSNFGYSGTTGKLGVVADYAIYGTPGPLQNSRSLMALNSNNYTLTDSHGTVYALPNTVTNAFPPGQYNTRGEAATSLVFCCAILNTTYTNKDELLKLRYAFSPATTLTTSFLGSQTYADQNGNNGNQLGTFFAPSANYAGPVKPGGLTIVDPDNYGSPAWEINNEPMFQGELRTALGRDTVLARYYTASISRLQYGANHNPNGTNTFGAAVYGAVPGLPSFNGADPYGKAYQLTIPTGAGYYDSAEEDRLHGESVEYDHFLGASDNIVSLSYDTNRSATHSYYFGDTVDSVPAGSTQDTSTILLRGLLTFGKLNVTASNYLTDFRSHFGVYDNAFTSAQTLVFKNQDLWHEDARLGLVLRPNASTSLRASAGSALAPPYLGALVTYASPPQLCGTNGTVCPVSGVLSAVDSEANPGLRPETSFGYDVGADWRLKDRATVVSGDLYLTNLRNQLVQSQFLNGTAVIAGHGALPLYTTAYTNVSNARYEGAELSLRREPPVGIGYSLSGAVLRAFPYNVDPSLYAPVDGIPQSNLGVVSNINFGSHQTIDNQAIPYAQGYGEVSLRTRHGELFSFGETYYGRNNSMNVHAFTVANATARTTVERQTTLQVSVDNLFNVFSDPLPTEYTGIGQPFVGGQFYASNANTVGPRVVRLSITHAFGNR